MEKYILTPEEAQSLRDYVRSDEFRKHIRDSCDKIKEIARDRERAWRMKRNELWNVKF